MSKQLTRLVRRWWVPRSEYDTLYTALRVARSLVIRHHDCAVVQSAGCFCPVCHRKDGTEPEIDLMHSALDAANTKVSGGGDKH